MGDSTTHREGGRSGMGFRENGGENMNIKVRQDGSGRSKEEDTTQREMDLG